MNPLHRIRLADCPDQPWRNGGGTTRELLAWPPGGDWTLRLSVARIDRDGPFSAYPEVGRHFAVVDGAGVRLDWPLARHRLTPADGPLAFDGADAPDCTLLDGPTHDLNLMVARRHGVGRLLPARAGVPWRCAAPWRGLYSHGSTQLLRSGPGVDRPSDATAAADTAADLADLGAGTLLWSETAAGQTWTLTHQAAAWWIEFEPHRAKDDGGGP